jgi:hypothetical protein
MTIHPTTTIEKAMMTTAPHGNRSFLDMPELGSGGSVAGMTALL